MASARRRGPAPAVPWEDGREGLRRALPTLAGCCGAEPCAGGIDRLGDQTAWARSDGLSTLRAMAREVDAAWGSARGSQKSCWPFPELAATRRTRPSWSPSGSEHLSSTESRRASTGDTWGWRPTSRPHRIRSCGERWMRPLPAGSTREWNWAVLDLASEICLPARPRCDTCPLVERCAFGSQVA